MARYKQQFKAKALRQKAKRDSNEDSIVSQLQRLPGVSVAVISLGGIPDLLVGYAGQNFLLEVKTDKGKLTPDQEIFFNHWHGQKALVRDIEDAKRAIGYNDKSPVVTAPYLPPVEYAYCVLMLIQGENQRLRNWAVGLERNPPKDKNALLRYHEIPALFSLDPIKFWRDFRKWLKNRPIPNAGEFIICRAHDSIIKYRRCLIEMKTAGGNLESKQNELFNEYIRFTEGLLL